MTTHAEHLKNPVRTQPEDLEMWARSTHRELFVNALEGYRTASKHAGPGVTIAVWWHHDNTFTFAPDGKRPPAPRNRPQREQALPVAASVADAPVMEVAVTIAPPVRKRICPV